jgi:hypothetical protein
MPGLCKLSGESPFAYPAYEAIECAPLLLAFFASRLPSPLLLCSISLITIEKNNEKNFMTNDTYSLVSSCNKSSATDLSFGLRYPDSELMMLTACRSEISLASIVIVYDI